MLNRIILMGRLTRDPELRHTQTGTAVASFSLAVDRDFRNRDSGEKGVDFIDVVAWRNTAEFVSKYFTKGRMAVVEGRLQIRDWTDGRAASAAALRWWPTTSISATPSATAKPAAHRSAAPPLPPTTACLPWGAISSLNWPTTTASCPSEKGLS